MIIYEQIMLHHILTLLGYQIADNLKVLPPAFSVTRNKKRTAAAVPTLRSNKKVSGLVDKVTSHFIKYFNLNN